MLKTVEAEIGPDGTVTLLESVKVKKKSRALVTVLGNGASPDNREAILALAGSWDEMNGEARLNMGMPTNEDVSDEDVLSVWTRDKESAQDIARELRERNRQTK